MRRVVILGGGFAGAFTAKNLLSSLGSECEIELINPANYFVFQPLLPEVAAGIINSSDAVTPLRSMLPGVKFRMAEVVSVDFDAKELRVLQGSRRIPISLSYDHLVFAVGQRGNLDMLPGFADHSITMKNLSDAHRLRNHIIECLEHADITQDEALKRMLLTFVVAGGGFSGVETVGEMAEMIRRTVRHYPNIDHDEVRLLVVQRESRILMELPEELATFAQKKLSKRGVEIRTGAGLASANKSGVVLSDGERIKAATLVATIGNGPVELVQQLPIELLRGKIPTDQCLRVQAFDDVWAVGDCAAIPMDASGEQFAPPTAQFATAEAEQLALNIAAAEKQRPVTAFQFEAKGSLASIGHYSAVAKLFGIKISGLLAWFLWRGFYIMRLPGFSTKARVTLNWMYDYLLPRNIVQLKGYSALATVHATYLKGDVLFLAGQIPDGLYTIESGSLESRVVDSETGQEHVRVLGAGEHWGERSLSRNWQTSGSLVALEDTRVLILKKEDFSRLRASLPVFDAYLEQLPDDRYAPSLRKQ